MSRGGRARRRALERAAVFRYPQNMDIIKQLGLIFAFGFAGEALAHLFPGGMPASVLGLFLMLAFLGFRVLKPEDLGKTADFLSANMAFFFLPAVALVLSNYAMIKEAVLQLLVICILCTLITFGVSYCTVRLFQVILKKRR